MDYRNSGVDRDRIEEFKQRFIYPFISDRSQYSAPLNDLVNSVYPPEITVDGIGTKALLLAQKGLYHYAGYDLVNHLSNDLAVSGVRLSYLADYISFTQLTDKQLSNLILGIMGACYEMGVRLIGGETAQMPGYYPKGCFELVGMGIGNRYRKIDSSIISGDKIIGLPSNGPHTNGYSLIRSILFDSGKYTLDSIFQDKPLWYHILQSHLSYAKLLEALPKDINIKRMGHITGGGIPNCIKRIIPSNYKAIITKGKLASPPIFDLIATEGEVEQWEMFNTFNMGIGYILIVDNKEVSEIDRWIKGSGVKSEIIGEIGENETKGSQTEFR